MVRSKWPVSRAKPLMDDFMPTAAGDPAAVDAEGGKALLPADDKIRRSEDEKTQNKREALTSWALLC